WRWRRAPARSPGRRSCRQEARRSSVLRRQVFGLQHQPLDPAAVLDVDLQDLVDVGGILVAVPHALGIDDHVGPELAAVEAPGGVAADALDAELPRLFARIAAQLLDATGRRRAGAARAARMALRPRVGADEKVM